MLRERTNRIQHCRGHWLMMVIDTAWGVNFNAALLTQAGLSNLLNPAQVLQIEEDAS